ncbi:HPt (histidine-containing phosphotransfer) domain-containing protein [Pustulibacterium marinum]|uniref:HPt (Histidine-containing phosphotransfer) domain-containing protein n=1 Tax=Pustulibacterium marinum TaxID=1224947 RepID=A0A1I7F9V0_9FLAO|nr:Hpt domain-containing protein [Pustulibacterium marinum]SFU32978.1 HPt (histidine-containing phosphotransfer) domain-containing protein [Pustulibacterium marinum]
MYNLVKLEELSGGDSDFIVSVITLFIEEVPEDILQISKGIDEKDFTKIYQHAHKIKPNVDLVGLDLAFQKILEIEQSAKSENMPEVLEKYAIIKSEVEDAVEALKKDFKL